MQREISNALSFAISKGYQIHPDAFAMLKGLDIDILKVVQDIVKMKIKHKESSSRADASITILQGINLIEEAEEVPPLTIKSKRKAI